MSGETRVEAAALIRWAARWHNEHDTHLSDFPVAFLDGLAKRIESGEVTPPAPHPQGGTPLVWVNDDIGYRCPKCALYVCIPKQDGATCPDCHAEKEN